MTRALCVVLTVIYIAGCTTSVSEADEASAEQSYIEDTEGYARDLGGLTSFEVASRSLLIDFGRSSCDVLDAGGTIEDVLLEVSTAYDTSADPSADQPLTQEETVLLTIYAMTAAVDNFCPKHRDALNDFLEG